MAKKPLDIPKSQKEFEALLKKARLGDRYKITGISSTGKYLIKDTVTGRGIGAPRLLDIIEKRAALLPGVRAGARAAAFGRNYGFSPTDPFGPSLKSPTGARNLLGGTAIRSRPFELLGRGMQGGLASIGLKNVLPRLAGLGMGPLGVLFTAYSVFELLKDTGVIGGGDEEDQSRMEAFMEDQELGAEFRSLLETGLARNQQQDQASRVDVGLQTAKLKRAMSTRLDANQMPIDGMLPELQSLIGGKEVELQAAANVRQNRAVDALLAQLGG